MHATVIFNKYRDNTIQKEIIGQLKIAEKSINIAVAWLTDEDIIRVLVQRAEAGILVSIIICNSKENFKNTTKFRDLLRFHGKLFVTTNPFMHHKFCIIDEKVIINGSYNWSYTARENEENIIILSPEETNADDALLIKKFVVKHTYLAEKCSAAIVSMEILNSFKNNTTDMATLISDLDEMEIQKRKEFEDAVRTSIEESRRIKIQFDYTKLLERMQRDGGGVNFVKRLLHEEMQTGEMKSGFRKLEEQDPPRIDLSLEYLVAQSIFKILFTSEEVTFCTNLMKKYNYLF